MSPLMWLALVAARTMQGSIIQITPTSERQKVSNKKIACLVNRYQSERGNLAIIKAK